MLCENFYQMSIGLKRTALAAGLAAASIISPVKADDSGFYLTGSVGVSNQDESTWTSRSDSTVKGKVDFDESAGVFNGGLGYDFGSFRVEATLGKTNGDLDKYQVTGPNTLAAADASGNYTLESVFLSGYYDISLGDSKFSPYLGGGIGRTNVDIESLTTGGVTLDGNNDVVTSYQGTIGVSYAATENSDVFVQGQYQSIGKAEEILSSNFEDLSNLRGSVGLRFRF